MEQERQIRAIDKLERFVMGLLVIGAIAIVAYGFSSDHLLVACGFALIPVLFLFLLKVKRDENRRRLADLPLIQRAKHLHATRAMNALAKEFDCTTVEDETGLPSFLISRGDQSVQFHAASKNLLIRSAFPVGNFRLFVWPERHMASAFRNVVDTRIGDPEFDQRFVIQTNDSEKAVRVLNRVVLDQIQALADLVEPEAMGVSLNGGEILLTVPLPESSNLESAWKCLSLMQTLQKQLGIWSDKEAASAIHVLPVKPDPRKVISCLVCGDKVVSQKVRCRQCRTPHHKECWEYVGKCSVFGCGSTRFDQG